MKHGPGWVVIESSYYEPTRKLVSILSPRRTARDIGAYIEQLYVDRFASIQGRLDYKKSRKSATHKVVMDMFGGPILCGHDPSFIAIPAREIVLAKGLLEVRYQIAANTDDPFNPVFEERRQSIKVDV